MKTVVTLFNNLNKPKVTVIDAEKTRMLNELRQILNRPFTSINITIKK